MNTIDELKAKRDALAAELKAAEQAIRDEEHRVFLEKLASVPISGKVSRLFLVWFGYSGPNAVRSKTSMTAEQLKAVMDPMVVRDLESFHGPMAINAVSKHRFYAAQR